MIYKDLVKKLQSEMNKLGSKLTVDGDPGPNTQDELFKYDVALILSNNIQKLPNIAVKPPWIARLESRLGWTERSHDKEISKGWPLTGLNYKTVIGKKYAWCGLAQADAMNFAGIKPVRHSAGARNWSAFGEPCDFICGAIISMKHAKGGNHVTCFLYWVDEKRRLAACGGGNQGDAYKISVYNLSGNKAGHDEVVGGPRWPTGYPKTGYVYQSKGDVVGEAGESTR